MQDANGCLWVTWCQLEIWYLWYPMSWFCNIVHDVLNRIKGSLIYFWVLIFPKLLTIPKWIWFIALFWYEKKGVSLTVPCGFGANIFTHTLTITSIEIILWEFSLGTEVHGGLGICVNLNYFFCIMSSTLKKCLGDSGTLAGISWPTGLKVQCKNLLLKFYWGLPKHNQQYFRGYVISAKNCVWLHLGHMP